jgi:hypothetical protein
MNDYHETPDIEVAADQWEEEQKVLRMLAEEDDGLEDARGLSECMEECARLDAEAAMAEEDGAAWEAERAVCYAEHLYDTQREDAMLAGRMS